MQEHRRQLTMSAGTVHGDWRERISTTSQQTLKSLNGVATLVARLTEMEGKLYNHVCNTGGPVIEGPVA